MQELRTYLRRVMEAKGITGQIIEQRCSGAITDSYVSRILTGQAKNISVEKVVALAKGLGVDPVEVFKAAAGLKADHRQADPWPSRILVQTVTEIVNNPELTDIVKRLVDLKPTKLRAVKKLIEPEKKGR